MPEEFSKSKNKVPKTKNKTFSRANVSEDKTLMMKNFMHDLE